MKSVITERSSNIKSVSYDEDSKNMIVEFRNGLKYSYEDVPEHMFEGLVNSPSAGKFFAYNIRLNFKCSRLNN